MALRLQEGMEFQIVLVPGPGGMGFEVFTRSKVMYKGQAVYKDGARRRAHDEAAAWVLISQLAQDRLVGLADEAG
ncbi:MAG: hypothetical protein VW516_11975 [Rhodospirillaceae bacterium]|jgi:hypothetical protein